MYQLKIMSELKRSSIKGW